MTAPATHAAGRWWGRGKLDVVAQEVVAPGAIADLVGCVFDRRKLERRIEFGYQPILEWAPIACVNACAAGPLTTRELSLATGISLSHVRKASALAVASGIARTTLRHTPRSYPERPRPRGLRGRKCERT